MLMLYSNSPRYLTPMLRRILLAFFVSIFVGCAASTPAPTATQPFAAATATLERAPVRTSLVDGTAAAPPPALTGKFIYAPGDGSIWVQDPASGKPNPVLKPSAEIFTDAPQWSPDGKSFVYVQSSLTEQGTAQNAIYRANADGSKTDPVAIPPNAKTALNWPHYSWDGKWVYYTMSYPVPPNKQHSEIDRIAVGGGGAAKSGGRGADVHRVARRQACCFYPLQF